VVTFEWNGLDSLSLLAGMAKGECRWTALATRMAPTPRAYFTRVQVRAPLVVLMINGACVAPMAPTA
jgi:hypothetical protein